MPITSLSIRQQLQSATSGIFTIPQMTGMRKNFKVIDEFNRDDLNPTSKIAVYQIAGTGAQSVSIVNQGILQLQTGGQSNDDVSIKTINFTIKRAARFIDDRSIVELDIIFEIDDAEIQAEGFIGIDDQNGSMDVIPTTNEHAGVFWNSGAGAGNLILSSGDGTTQSTTDTNQAVANGDEYRLNLRWTAQNAAEVKLFDGAAFNSQVGSTHTVSANLVPTEGFGTEIRFFCEATEVATKTIKISEWQAAFS